MWQLTLVEFLHFLCKCLYVQIVLILAIFKKIKNKHVRLLLNMFVI